MTRKNETIAHLDASIARWKTRLKRSVTMIDKLEKRRKRLVAKPPAIPASTLVAAVKGHIKRQTEKVVVFEPETVIDRGAELAAVRAPQGLDIPEFLRRGQAAQKAADAVVADQIREEQAATKKAKAQGRIAKMKAKKAGDLKKMPLSGKAALDHIDNG